MGDGRPGPFASITGPRAYARADGARRPCGNGRRASRFAKAPRRSRATKRHHAAARRRPSRGPRAGPVRRDDPTQLPDERRTANAETGSTARRASREAGRATRDARRARHY
ncbi:hypothetical protein BMA721280_K0034 [Burkholderia mallei 2002721280]|uniref:Uncharacterized protein n=1 Tax=Burkholderia mallei (strain NCTC 10229) TaxID=412022 RepID=A2RYE4_BURM9|nr:hypothetical protein BMA10229_0900 [Burkholderia mallei NCTC 10229]EDK82877.1 hypothetical protein BMA721280_K0034 [Burkholderia mallei 2002721280]KKM53068.1 hypothetical protein VT71_08405 [Burkholderia mallei]